MRRYECVVILEPELPDDDIKNFTEKYSQLIKTSSGEVIKIEDWGIKRLAYLVKKKDKGRYILFDFVGLPALISEMERQLKISDEVMKYLSVKLDESVDLEAFKAAKEEPAATPAETAEVATAAEEATPVAAAVETEQKPAEEASEAPVTEEVKEGE
jgi:small subunit ribosomal protein S6